MIIVTTAAGGRVEHTEGTYFENEASGDLNIFGATDAFIGVHARGTWHHARVENADEVDA